MTTGDDPVTGTDLEATGDPLFTPDELDAIDVDPTGFPLSPGVTAARATGYCVMGLLGFVEGTFRTRPPTARQVEHWHDAGMFAWFRV